MRNTPSQEDAHRRPDPTGIHHGLLYTVLNSSPPTRPPPGDGTPSSPWAHFDGLVRCADRAEKAHYISSLVTVASSPLPGADVAATWVDPLPADRIAEHLEAAGPEKALGRVVPILGCRDIDSQLMWQKQQASRRRHGEDIFISCSFPRVVCWLVRAALSLSGPVLRPRTSRCAARG
ncbi:hypothetical protein MMC34_001903 [Xylographa carneopallida]|nr:hypothetical protein [Xylographa carneopallida]